MAITKQDVVGAFEQLKQMNGGENPTRQDVRDYLGTGSMTTINKYMKEYIDEQETRLAIGNEDLMPNINDVGGDLMRLLRGMELRIRQLESEVASLRDELGEDLDVLFDENDFPDLNPPRAVGE